MELIKYYQEDPRALLELAVANNLGAVRDQAVFLYPGFINQTAEQEDIMQLIDVLLAQGDVDGVMSLFVTAIDYGQLTPQERDAVLYFGGLTQQKRYKTTGAEQGGAATGFDWGSVIGGLTGVITGAFDAFGPNAGNNAAPYSPAPQQQQTTDYSPLITAAKWVVGGIVAGFIIWGIVKLTAPKGN